MDPGAPINQWYLAHREGSVFNVDDWEGFRDPARLTYSDYVVLQHERETYVDLLIDHHEQARSAAGLDPAWVSTLAQVFVPLRFPLHVLQMTGLYVGQMAPSAFIVNCANFQASDELRRIQRIAYTTALLGNAHGAQLASTAAARDPWEHHAPWQPLREVSERLLGVHDWGESFAALNLALKPMVDVLVNEYLAAVAEANGDVFLAHLLTEFTRDSTRSRDWTVALVQYAISRDPAMADVLRPWVERWTPPATAALAGLAPVVASAPRSIDGPSLVERASAAHAQLLTDAGL
jgi:toluene monooxygenase system protein E